MSHIILLQYVGSNPSCRQSGIGVSRCLNVILARLKRLYSYVTLGMPVYLRNPLLSLVSKCAVPIHAQVLAVRIIMDQAYCYGC